VVNQGGGAGPSKGGVNRVGDHFHGDRVVLGWGNQTCTSLTKAAPTTGLGFRAAYAVFLLSQHAVPSLKQDLHEPTILTARDLDLRRREGALRSHRYQARSDSHRPQHDTSRPARPFIRLELLGYELRGATFRIRA
jgi:hypothetical protein